MTDHADLDYVLTDSAAGGAIVLWTLSGTVELDALTVALDRVSLLSLAPGEVTLTAVLKRALDAWLQPNWFRRKLKKQDGRKGYAVLEEYEDNSTSIVNKVWLDGTAIRMEYESHTLRAELDAARTTLLPDDVSTWLTRKVVRALDARALRDSGGVYYVPQDKQAQLQRVRDAVHACSAHKLYRAPALKCDDTCEMVLDSVIADAREGFAALDKKLVDGKVGARGARSSLDKLTAKLTRYEKLFDKRIPELHTALDELDKRVAFVALAAAGEEKSNG